MCYVDERALGILEHITVHNRLNQIAVAQIQTGEYIKVLETDTQSVAFEFEGQIDEETNTITGFIFDRLMPGDKEELQILEIMNTVPVDAEERDKLLAIIHEARKYW